MIIDTLKLTQFRNYDTASMTFHPKVNALTGMNGMGKTNVLDALYYLCLGKSYFSGSDKTVIKLEKDFFRLEAKCHEDDQKEVIVVKSKLGLRKEIEISNKKVEKISDHVGRFLCVIIAPDDIQLMLEGSEERRNFLNNTIVQSNKSYLDDLLMYNALLKRRNTLLKSFAENKKFDPLLLESVTVGMYAPAARIYEHRKEAIEQMLPVFLKAYHEISGNREHCSITYESQLTKVSLEYLMQAHIEKDRILARTTHGIHKDDLVFMMNGEPLRNFASQGQLKSFVLALKLTQYRVIKENTGRFPILLLDDIFDKLDENRVLQLLNMLVKQSFGQIFITDTNEHRICKILEDIGTEYRNFTVVDGNIT